VRSLVVSDLHLGSVMRRDVLRRSLALDRLLEAVEGVDRLVLLGDVVEMLEGRPGRAMRDAEPVLREIGDVAGKGREVLYVPGNHDHRVVAPFLRRLRAEGKPLRPSHRVPKGSSPALEALTSWLGPAKVEVRYPGVRLREDVWAHHGHYVDRELLPTQLDGPMRLKFRALPDRMRPEDYERAAGPNFAAAQAALQSELPTLPATALEVAAGAFRELALRSTPLLAGSLRDRLAPLGAGFLGWQFRTRGMPAMAAVARRLGIRADHVVFGHLHLGGPAADEEWRPVPGGPALLNTGCWVHEPLLLGGVDPPHDYWPGGAVLVPDEGPPVPLRLLDDLRAVDLR
jgi:predicted phosphodiesterase